MQKRKDMTASMPDQPRADESNVTSLALDRQQVRFLLDGEVEFPGVDAGMSLDPTEPVDPSRDVQNNSDAAPAQSCGESASRR